MIKESCHYNLQNRTFDFAQNTRLFVKKLPQVLSNLEDIKQLVRSSGSVGANYIEANESLSRKDFSFRIKICRKEAKESQFWLKLIDCGKNPLLEEQLKRLLKEAEELTKIFSAIIIKTQS